MVSCSAAVFEAAAVHVYVTVEYRVREQSPIPLARDHSQRNVYAGEATVIGGRILLLDIWASVSVIADDLESGSILERHGDFGIEA